VPTDEGARIASETGAAMNDSHSRPHLWPCRHCAMVDDYRLLREAQLDYAEGPHNRDENYRLVTFKDWLRAYQWEQPPEESWVIPEQRGSTSAVDPIDAARRAVSAIPDPIAVDASQPPTSDTVDKEGRCCV
jgi:hypothetical protein